jgi:hypothetical protein
MPVGSNTHYYAKESNWTKTYIVFFDENDKQLSVVKYGESNTGVYGEIPAGASYALCGYPYKKSSFVIFAEEPISNNANKLTDLIKRYVNEPWGKLEINGLQSSFTDESIPISKIAGSGAKMYNLFSNTIDPVAKAILIPKRKQYHLYNMSNEGISNGSHTFSILKKNKEEKIIYQSFINPGERKTCTISDDDYDDVVAVYFVPDTLTEEQLAGLMISERSDLTEYHPYGEFYYEPNNDMKKLVQSAKEEVIKQYDGGVLLGIGDSYMQNNALLSNIATKHGLVCDNRGVASSSISGDEAQTVGLYPFWSRINAAVTEYSAGHMIDGSSYKCDDVKLIVFIGGANDGWIDTRLGSGKTETDTKTLYGALNVCFSTLLSNFPNADIVVILQPVNYNQYPSEWTEEQAVGYGYKSKEDALKFSTYQIGQYAMHTKEAIVKEMAELYGLNIVDCCFNWFSVVNPNDRAKYWSTDKLHLSSDGSKQLYDVALENKINSLKVTRN